MIRKIYCYLLAPILLLACKASNQPIKEQVAFDNVLLIISDDLATHAVGCYGNTIIRTPNIDQLAEMGVRFENAYANSPMCTPSRACIMTGRYPQATGVTLLHTPLPDSIYTVAEHLKSWDFATGIFGKTHFNSDLKHGFDTLVNNPHHKAYLEQISSNDLPDSIRVRPPWKPFQDHARIWLNAEGATSGNLFEHSQGTFFARAAIDFIRKNQSRRFFAVASFREPHSPFNFPVEYQGQYDHNSIMLPPTSKEDERWIPKIFKDLTNKEKIGITRSYYTSVEYMDRNVGLLIHELKRLSLMENTLVVFVGDHGYLLNHHGRFEKHMMWEEAVKTPLIITGYRKNKTITTKVELADIAPTIVKSLNVPNMPHQHGQPLQDLLNGNDITHRPYIFSVYYTDNKAMVFDGRWKYIFTSGKNDLGSGYATGLPPSGVLHRLYDLKHDPRESKNVALLPENKEKLEELQQIMLEKFRDSYPKTHAISSTLNIEEQLVLFCEPPENLK